MLLLLILVNLGVLLVGGDTYLEAYADSHNSASKSDREYIEQFTSPHDHYGPPTVIYGPPAPVISYEPPGYGPSLAPSYGVPHGMLSLFDRLKFKLDLFTVGKIILKIFLFKKFVSFVAILCLLFFIPTLKNKVDEGLPDDGDDDDDDGGGDGGARTSSVKRRDEFLNNLSNYVIGSIEKFPKTI